MTVTLALAGSGPAHAQTAAPPAHRIASITGDAVAKVSRYVGPSRDYGFGVASVPFELPAASKQGTGQWFLLRLRVALVLRKGSRDAPAQVSAATNGFTAIQMQIAPSGNRDGAVIDMLDLLQGEVRDVSTDGVAVADESNYVQLAGVHGGRNTLSLRIDAFGRHAIVNSARLLPGTGIYATAKAPSNLTIKAPRAVRIRTGTTVRFPVRLVDTGDDARNITVTVAATGTQLRVRTRSYHLAAIAAGRPRTVNVELQARSPGQTTIDLSAVSSGNQPSAQTAATLYANRRSTLVVVLICIAVFVPAALALAWPRRRQRNT